MLDRCDQNMVGLMMSWVTKFSLQNLFICTTFINSLTPYKKRVYWLTDQVFRLHHTWHESKREYHFCSTTVATQTVHSCMRLHKNSDLKIPYLHISLKYSIKIIDLIVWHLQIQIGIRWQLASFGGVNCRKLFDFIVHCHSIYVMS